MADAPEAPAKELAKSDVVDTEAFPKKKKKKHKETAEPPDTSDTGDAVITNGDTGVEDIGDGGVPKRKKKKRVTVPTADETDVVSIANGVEVEGCHSPVAKKAKKKKKQREEEGADLPDSAAATIEGGGDIEGIQVAKKAKKKKHKHKENESSDESGDVLGKKRKHEGAELNSGDVDGGVVQAKKHKRGGGLETGTGTCSEHDLELLSDGASQTVVKKHKKKHKHKKEQPLS